MSQSGQTPGGIRQHNRFPRAKLGTAHSNGSPWRDCVGAGAASMAGAVSSAQHLARYVWCAARGFIVAVQAALLLGGTAYSSDTLAAYRIVNGAIPEPLTAQPGDPDRGRRVVLDRDGGDCLICHAMALPQR